ncbi:hypothetical protein RR48_02714 [Papilio machaon]|uniref:Chitin-binding type-2 domain-containing protein n=1 Tax=Papilio machaon TaxID=76193 RepID=A0A0N1I8W5_PAPMA|nr:hypothetical protein RR48_02714 [Papilio machaon]
MALELTNVHLFAGKLVPILFLLGSVLAGDAEPSTTAKTTTAKVTTAAPTTTTTAKPTTKTNGTESITPFKPFEGVDPNTLSCDPQGQIFLLLPHFTDCTKFFMCAHGEEVQFVCAGGLYFDFERQTCNWPRDTICILRDLPEDNDVEGSGEEAFDWLSDNADKHSDGSVVSLTADAVLNAVRPLSLEAPHRGTGNNIILNCFRADSASRQVPYKGDCQRYWRCLNGVPQVAYCTDGLFFNERTQQCDFEANITCQVEQEDELKSEFIKVK